MEFWEMVGAVIVGVTAFKLIDGIGGIIWEWLFGK